MTNTNSSGADNSHLDVESLKYIRTYSSLMSDMSDVSWIPQVPTNYYTSLFTVNNEQQEKGKLKIEIYTSKNLNKTIARH